MEQFAFSSAVSYTHLRAHETPEHLVCRLLLEKNIYLELPNFNHKFKKNSFTYSSTKLWNSLSSQVRLSSDANDFKSKLHDCSFLERVLLIVFQSRF